MSRNSMLLGAAAVIVAIGLGYYFFFFNKSGSAAISLDGAPASDAELSFITLVSRLDPVTFDTTILSDPRFTSRADIRTPIISEPVGRNDPFAPIGK